MLFGFDTKKKKILTMLTLVMLVGTAFLSGAVLATTPSTWSDQPTYIGPGSMVTEASYIIFKDIAGATCAKNGVDGKIDYRSQNSSYVIQSAMNNVVKGTVLITAGEYVLDYDITLMTNVSLVGQDKKSVRLTTAPGYECRIGTQSHSEISNMEISGSVMVYILSMQNISNPKHSISVHDMIFTVGSVMPAAIYMVSASFTGDAVLDDVEIYNVDMYDIGSFGVLITAVHSGDTTSNVTMTNVNVYNAGLYTRYNEWVTSFDLRESATVKDIKLYNCLSYNAWESGFHIETVVDPAHNVILTDCISIGSGQKPGHSYGHGFVVIGGLTLTNCVAKNNAGSGFYITNQGYLEDANLYNCVDYGSSVGFNIVVCTSPVNAINCISYDATDFGWGIVSSPMPRGRITIDGAAYNSANMPLDVHLSNNITAKFRSEGGGGLALFDCSIMIGTPNIYGVTNSSFDLDVTIPDISGVSNAVSVYGKNITISGIIRFETDIGIYLIGDRCVFNDLELYGTSGTSMIDGGLRGGYTNNTFSNIVISASGTFDRGFGGYLYNHNTIGSNVVFKTGTFIIPFDQMWFIYRSGIATITAGTTHVHVTHYCAGVDDTGFVITPMDDVTGVSYWISSVSVDEFVITRSGTTGNVDFAWVYISEEGVL
jgi:hypothetical protein